MRQACPPMIFACSVRAALMTFTFAALAASDARADTPAPGLDSGAADASRAEPVAASAGLQMQALGRVLGQVQAALGGREVA